MVQMNFIFNLIKQAAIEKIKRKNIIESQNCTGGKYKNKSEKNLLLFFQFSKNWVGKVGKTKNKKTLAQV